MSKFAKLVDGRVEFAPKNYLQYINFDLDEELMRTYGYKLYIPAERPDIPFYAVQYEEDENTIKQVIVISAEDAQKNEIAKREILDRMELTPADVERALYKAKGMDFDDLKEFVKKVAPNMDIKALGVELRANTFYRGATLADGIRLIDTVGALLGYTPEDMDYLFENKELPS